MEEIKAKIAEMTEGLNSLIDSSVEFFPDTPITEHFPAESVDYMEIDGRMYKVKMIVEVKRI